MISELIFSHLPKTFIASCTKTHPYRINTVNCSVFDSLSTKGLMMVGELYNLSPKDLWRASSKVNQPEVVSSKGKGKGRATQGTAHEKARREEESACKSS